ncbi:MAG: TPR end-of-group domain-containing protein, partial [Planctomycetota bacterium]
KLLQRLFGGGTISLAVLPLENLSGDPEEDYFADGMTETLIEDLSKISALRVIPSASVMRYKDHARPLPEIGRELNADAILEGSVLRAGNTVQITTRFVHAATGLQLWADHYESDLASIQATQQSLSRDIASEIQLQLTPRDQSRLAAEQTVSPEAHEAYLKGRFAARRPSAAGAEKALEFYAEAIRLEPEYAAAYAGRADAYWLLEERYQPPKETMPHAKDAALKALELNPDLAEAYVSLGRVKLFYDWDWDGAYEAFQRALDLNPRLTSAHLGIALYMTAMQRHDEAFAAMERALEMDPVSLVTDDTYGMSAYQARRYDEAIDYSQRAIDLDPTFSEPYSWLGLALAAQGRFDEAIAALETARGFADSPIIIEFLGGVYAMAGREADAFAMLEELDRQSKYRFICPYEIATIYIALGDHDEAFKWLTEAYEERSACVPWLNTDPRLDPIRDDPRFEELQRLTGHRVADPTL